MKISFSNDYTKLSNTVILGVGESLKLAGQASKLNQKTSGTIERGISASIFAGKKGQTLTLNAPTNLKNDRIILVGLGKENAITDLEAEEIGGAITAVAATHHSTEVSVIIEGVRRAKDIAARIAHGIVLRSYRFEKYKTKQNDTAAPALKKATIHIENHLEAQKQYDFFDAVAEGVFLGRDVVTEPPNELYPASYAARIKKEFAKSGATVKILSEKQMTKLGMGSLLGVGQGSERESKMVIIEWKGNKKAKSTPLALVGKGVTFDTGGISLKPSNGMWDMKYDMGGSAAVVGAMKALAKRKAKVNVVGVVGLVENMPSHNAQRPSDVVTSMSGQTIEVLNTDAEGRLVLADALWYAQKQYKVKTVVNLATLTGAIVVALGGEHAGIFTNSDELHSKLIASGTDTGEKLWRFPLNAAYDKMLDSPIADMQNISVGGGAGSITAAQFLQRFIMDDVQWAHLDIAGVAWTKKNKKICPKGATGFGVRLLNDFVAKHFEA